MNRREFFSGLGVATASAVGAAFVRQKPICKPVAIEQGGAGDSEEIGWGDQWLPVIQEVLGIKEETHSIDLFFETSKSSYAVTQHGCGTFVNRPLSSWGIVKIKEVLGLNNFANSITIRIHKGEFVRITYAFGPERVSPIAIASVLKA